MENREYNRKDLRNGMIFGAILLLAFLVFLWINPLNSSENFSFKEQLIYTLLIIVAVSLGIIFYFHQKKIDMSNNLPRKNNVKNKLFRVSNKIDSVFFKGYSIKWAIIGILFLFGGGYIIISTPQFWWLGILLIVCSVLLIIVVKNFWKRSNEKFKGRFY